MEIRNMVVTVQAYNGGQLFLDENKISRGKAFCSGLVIGYSGIADGDRIDEYVAFDPDTMTEIRE